MLTPKKQKYRKAHKGRTVNHSKGGTQLSYGSYGLKSLDMERINSRQIEAGRRAAVRRMSRSGSFWIRIFPDVPVSKKPAEVRMGNGKGNVEFWVSEIKPGKILYEMDGVQESVAREAFRLAAAKLPFKTSFVTRNFR